MLFTVFKNKLCNEVLVLGFPGLDPSTQTTVNCVACSFKLTKRHKGIKPPLPTEPRYLDYNLYSIIGACGACSWAPCCDPCCKKKPSKPCLECCCLTVGPPPCCSCGCRGLTFDCGCGACKRCSCIGCDPGICNVGCCGQGCKIKPCCPQCQTCWDVCLAGDCCMACQLCTATCCPCNVCKGWYCCEEAQELKEDWKMDYLKFSALPDYKGMIGLEITITGGVIAGVSPEEAHAFVGNAVVLYAGPSELISSAYEITPDDALFFKRDRYKPPNDTETACYKAVDFCMPWLLRTPYGLRKESVLAVALQRSGIGFDVILHSIANFRLEVAVEEVPAVKAQIMNRA